MLSSSDWVMESKAYRMYFCTFEAERLKDEKDSNQLKGLFYYIHVAASLLENEFINVLLKAFDAPET